MKKKTLYVILAVLLGMAVLALGAVLYARYNAANNFTETVQPATCTEDGYIITTQLSAGTTSVEKLPALGHAFGEWETGSDQVQTRSCSRCGYQESVRTGAESANDIPKLFLTGSLEGIGKKEKVTLEAEFVGMDQDFKSYVTMTLQGHSTYGLPKRNYKVRFFDDAEATIKHKLQLNDWNLEHKYILKANYDDLSQSRNLVGARIWTDMTRTRANLHPRVADIPRLGAVDGFPINVYLNEEFFGMYTFNLHKDEDLYEMEEGEQVAVVNCNQHSTDEAIFRARAEFLADFSSDWEVEFCGTEDESWVHDSFNSLIDFVMESSDEEFRNELQERLDVDAAIDYLIFIYALGLQNSGAKDLVFLNYDGVWLASAYDMDEAFGLDNGNDAYLAPEAFAPSFAEGVWESGTGSLLWDRLLNLFTDEIRARYNALRKDVLSEEHLISLVSDFIDEVPAKYYDWDANLYPGRPLHDLDMKSQILAYIPARLGVLDALIGVNE